METTVGSSGLAHLSELQAGDKPALLPAAHVCPLSEPTLTPSAATHSSLCLSFCLLLSPYPLTQYMHALEHKDIKTFPSLLLFSGVKESEGYVSDGKLKKTHSHVQI